MTSLTRTRGQHGPATAPRGPALPSGPRPRLPGPRTRLCAGAVGLLCTALAARGNRVGACEEAAFRAINGLPDALYPPGWVIMQLGTLGAAPATAGAAWLAGDRRLAGRLLAVGSVTWMLSKGVKHAVRRDRPATLLPDIRSRGRDAAGLGYLSGHAGVAFALGAAALPRLSRPGVVLAMGAAPAVALARVYVGAHLPLDIIGGAALGLAVEAGLALLTADPPLRKASDEPLGRGHHQVPLPGDGHPAGGTRPWPGGRRGASG
jgi:membrane-associated phospholipid phosphatase